MSQLRVPRQAANVAKKDQSALYLVGGLFAPPRKPVMPFGGFFFQNTESPQVTEGNLIDLFGPSKIVGGTLTENVLRFDKQYRDAMKGRTQSVSYVLRKTETQMPRERSRDESDKRPNAPPELDTGIPLWLGQWGSRERKNHLAQGIVNIVDGNPNNIQGEQTTQQPLHNTLDTGQATELSRILRAQYDDKWPVALGQVYAFAGSYCDSPEEQHTPFGGYFIVHLTDDHIMMGQYTDDVESYDILGTMTTSNLTLSLESSTRDSKPLISPGGRQFREDLGIFSFEKTQDKLWMGTYSNQYSSGSAECLVQLFDLNASDLIFIRK